MSENILTLTDAGFEADVLKAPAGKRVFVDFWAPWCGPCRMLAPHLEAAAAEYGDKIVVGKYNVDENTQVAADNGIRGIPTILVYKNGELIGQHTGAMARTELNAFIESYL